MHISIGKVDTPDELIEIAFARARKSTSRSRSSLRGKGLTAALKSRAVELMKLSTASEVIMARLDKLRNGFPHLHKLAPFYQELTRVTIDVDAYKKALGAVGWAHDQIQNLTKEARTRIRGTKDSVEVTKRRTAFYGRAASVLRQIKKELAYLDQCRKTLKEFPAIKTDLPTIVIAGHPNVGKSTLLKALTGASPKIAPYPFTTTNILIGYARGLQFIDTPGLFDRLFSKRNPIEKQAILALKHLATIILFVIDPTESCGYTLQQQAALFQQITSSFKTPMITVMTKLDIATLAQAKDAEQVVTKELVRVDTTSRTSVEELLSVIDKSVHATQKSS